MMWDRIKKVPEPQRLIAILWLSFLVAGVATTLFFAAVDPDQFVLCLDIPDLGRSGFYTIGFLGFWLLSASSSLLTTYFLVPRNNGSSNDCVTPDEADE